MPESILGLDITSHSVTAVQVTSRMKGYEVTACGHVSIEENKGFAEGLKALAEQMGLQADVSIGALPGEHVSYRNLRLPFKDNKKIRQTLAYELETIVPFPVDDLIVDFMMVEQAEQSEILAASVKRAWISEHLSQMQDMGIDPTVLDIRGVPTVSWLLRHDETPDDGLVLDIGVRGNTLILYVNRRIALIRTFPFDGTAPMGPDSSAPASANGDFQTGPHAVPNLEAFCTEVKNTLHAFSSHGRRATPQQVFLTGRGATDTEVEAAIKQFFEIPVKGLNLAEDPKIELAEDVTAVWDPTLMDNALAAAMRDGKQVLGFNFRRDEFEVQKQYFRHKKEIGKVAALAAIFLSLLCLDFGIDYHFLKKHHERIDQQITQVFRETFPDVKRIVDPVQQMQVKINEVKNSSASLPGASAKGTVLDLLNDISVRMPEGADVRMSRVVIEADVVLVKGETDTFNTVDAVKKSLEPSTYFSAVTISSANLDRSGNRVKFEMKLQRVGQ